MLLALLALPFLGAAAILLLRSAGAPNPRAIALFFTTVAAAVLAYLTLEWREAGTLATRIAWLPHLGLDFSIWLDGPALFYAWLVIGIGILVIQYAGHYMKPDDAPWRFYATLIAFLGAMLGVVISRNALLMFVFWEMTSITSFLLIGHWSHLADARAGAKRALIVTGLGGLALMGGLAVVLAILRTEGIEGPFEWDLLWQHADTIVAHDWAPAALILLLLGVFTKSAQFPFHFWLPGAMQAPTPVSAFLHAATMVKAGIYLLGRLYPIFNEMDLWLILVAGAGTVTMLIGGAMAIISRDLKQLLAFSTVSQLGLLTAYYGFGYQRVGGDDLLKLDLLLVASHALFKAGLFMLVGVIDHACHTRDWKRMGGLARKMPITAGLTIVGCLSMAGMPFTLGFVAKKLFLEAGLVLDTPMARLEDAFLYLAILGSVFTATYCIHLAVSPFFGKPRDQHVYDHAHEGNAGFLAAPFILIGATLIGGIYVPLIEKPLSLVVRPEFYSTYTKFTIAFFQKADFLFWVSIATYVIGGILVLIEAPQLDKLYRKMKEPAPFRGTFDKIFDVGIPKLAGWIGSAVVSASLQRNLAVIFAALLALMAVPAWRVFGGGLPQPDLAIPLMAFVMGAVILASAAIIILADKLMMRLLALGTLGLLVAGMFVLYKAPDLAITQILVELVILLMFLLLLRHIGRPSCQCLPPSTRTIALVLAIGSGIALGGLTYFAAGSEVREQPVLAGNPTHQDFYRINSKYPAEPGGHTGAGNNVVNVILVDFRALDTLGEVVVLVAAALGAMVLMRTPVRRRDDGLPDVREISEDPVPELPAGKLGIADWLRSRRLEEANPLVLRSFAGQVALLSAAFAVVLFFAGHNAPGGGFIGGLLTAAALVPYVLALGRRQLQPPLLRDPYILLPAGILVAAGTGLVAVALGQAFLRSGYKTVALPLFGDVGLSSALAFDLGVYMSVIGITLVLLREFSTPPESAREEAP